MNTLIYILLLLIFIFNIYSDMYVQKEHLENIEKTDFTKLLNPIGFMLVLYLFISSNSSKKGIFSM
jgi:hypothetical protein